MDRIIHRLTAVSVAVGFAMATTGLSAQTPPAPPAWKQGMPESMATSTLAPLAGKLTVTPATEIPIDRIKLPPGFKVDVWATGLPGGRCAGFDPNRFWRHVMGTAVAAQSLAQRLHRPPESLFVAGLLHDIGRLAMVSVYP